MMFEMAFIMVTFLFVASVRYFSGLTWTSSVHAGFKEPLSWSLYLPRWGLESAFPRVDVSNESQGISNSQSEKSCDYRCLTSSGDPGSCDNDKKF